MSTAHLMRISGKAVLVGGLLMAAAAPARAQAHYEGTIGPGAQYEIDVPATWNGNLVLYAHGIIQADEPVLPPSALADFTQIRAALLAGGWAIAASSFSSNGWALAEAVRQTHQLSGIFVSKVGQPQHTLLVGPSLGALVMVKLAETYRGQYDGVLAMCGPLGGAQEELQYVGDARVTFDFYFPGALPGSPFSVPAGTSFLSPLDPGGPSPLFLAVSAAFALDPAATTQWASAARLPFANPAEFESSLFYTIGFLLRYTNDFIERVNGKIPYDNLDTVYEVNVSDPVTNGYLSSLLNAGVARYAAAPAALNYYDRNYTPTGAVDVPVLTLHTTRDPAIPYAHETLYAAAVAAAGRSDLLLQRPIDRWGHCTFTPAEILTAFGDLAQWVATGIQP